MQWICIVNFVWFWYLIKIKLQFKKKKDKNGRCLQSNFAKTFQSTEILPPRHFPMCMSNAACQKMSIKGPLFRKDDCTLPVYLYLLVYAPGQQATICYTVPK